MDLLIPACGVLAIIVVLAMGFHVINDRQRSDYWADGPEGYDE